MNRHLAVLFLACFTFVVGFQVSANGPEKTPPPSIFLQAKTILIVNDMDESYTINRASDELKKWGRYQIVEKPDDADLVLVLTAREDLARLERSAGTDSYTTVYGESSTSSGSGPSYSTGTVQTVTQKSSTVAFFDGRTGRKVWSETRVWRSALGSAAGAIIKDLHKRVEAAEKDAAKP